jgi:hypothetical protein
VNRDASAPRPAGIDPSRKNSSGLAGQKRKTGPLCSRRRLHKGPILWCLFQILEAVCFAPGSRPGPAVSRPGNDYFRFDVFFATFLVAFAVFFFAFFAFLAMWSSVNDCFSEVAHAVYRQAQHTDITNAKLVPTCREVGLSRSPGAVGPASRSSSGAMLTLLRLPFEPVSRPANDSACAFADTLVLFLERTKGLRPSRAPG